MYNSICNKCGKEFSTTNKNTKYCSEKCRKEAIKDNFKKRLDRLSGETNGKNICWGKELIKCIKKNEYPDTKKTNGCYAKGLRVGGHLIEHIKESDYKKMSYCLKNGMLIAVIDGDFIDFEKKKFNRRK